MQRIERTERMMIRWMCGVKLSDRKVNAKLSPVQIPNSVRFVRRPFFIIDFQYLGVNDEI